MTVLSVAKTTCSVWNTSVILNCLSRTLEGHTADMKYGSIFYLEHCKYTIAIQTEWSTKRAHPSGDSALLQQPIEDPHLFSTNHIC